MERYERTSRSATHLSEQIEALESTIQSTKAEAERAHAALQEPHEQS